MYIFSVEDEVDLNLIHDKENGFAAFNEIDMNHQALVNSA